MAKQVIIFDDYKKDKQPFEDMPTNNVASEDLPIQIKKEIVSNNFKHDKNTFDEVISQFTIALRSPIWVKSEDVPNIIPTDKADKNKPIDANDNYFDATQDINKDQRKKSNVSLIVASNADDEVVLCSVDGNVKNEQDISPTQIIPALFEKKNNGDNDVTDCEFVEINFKNVPNDKNSFDEVVNQFTIALQSPIRVESEDILNTIPTDNADNIKPIHVDDNYFDATQDINKNQREKQSNVSLVVASNADDKVVLCSVDGNVKKEKDENENTYCGIDLPSQENRDDISANDATLTNVSDSSDEESTSKKSKVFTFTDSDLPDSDEMRDILMSYPKPIVVESFSESESESSLDDESHKFLRRFRKKNGPGTNIDITQMKGIEKLPDRVMTRLRNSARMFKPSYLKVQEAQMDEVIILENIKRLKSFKNAKTYKDSNNHESIKEEKKETTPRKKPDNKSNKHKSKVKVKNKKPQRKEKKSKTKLLARNNSKEDSLELNSISAATRRTRSMNKENDGKNSLNKCIFARNKNKKLDHKRIPSKKEITIFPEIEGRRSTRQQKAIEKNDDTMKAPISIVKKIIPKQSTVCIVSSSSSESPKSFKRSLVDDTDVPNPKRTRSHNNNNNNSISYMSLRATPARAVKTQSVHLSAFPGKENKQDKLNPYVHLVQYEPAEKRIRTLNSNQNILTRSQLARRRFHRPCKQTRQLEHRRSALNRNILATYCY